MSHIQAWRTRPPPDDDPNEQYAAPRRERWHVGKESPLALIVSILMSVLSGVWYASKTDARIMVIEKTIDQNGTIREDIAQLKEQVKNVDRLLQRLETVLDRRSEIEPKEDLKSIGGIAQ